MVSRAGKILPFESPSVNRARLCEFYFADSVIGPRKRWLSTLSLTLVKDL